VAHLQFDHFLTCTSGASIDDRLAEWAAQGFLPLERTVRHEPGLRNGFVGIGPEYLEFLWVEDEMLFAAGDEKDKAVRAACRPFGIGLVADDVRAVHADWTARGHALPAVGSKAARDASADAPPAWSFQEIPDGLLPGVATFALTYHARTANAVRKVRIAPNTIYAISGVTFVAAEPEVRATRWRDLLAPGEPVMESGAGCALTIGPHRATWTSPEAWHAAFGRPWTPAPHAWGEIALVHLLAEDLGTVEATMQAAGRKATWLHRSDGEDLLLEPDARDGFAFVVRRQPVESWRRERMERTGENLELETAASASGAT
jgi:hypothetical protein